MASKIEYIREILSLDLDYNPPKDYDPNISLDEIVKTSSTHTVVSRNYKIVHSQIKSCIKDKMDYHFVSIHENLIFGFDDEYIYLTRVYKKQFLLESIIMSKIEFNNDDFYLILNYGKWLR